MSFQLPVFSSKVPSTIILSKSIWILGKIAIFFSVGLAITARQELDAYQNIRVTPSEYEKNVHRNNEFLNSESSLSKLKESDIFGLDKQTVKKPNESEKKKSSLNLRLVGTSITSGKMPFAIIEDAKKKQDVFGIDEEVFEKATLKEIHSDRIILARDGELEVLEVEGGIRNPGESNIQSSGGQFIVPEEEVTKALENLPMLLSQARAVPYFRNGKSIGMRLYAIKSGSLYEKLGLKNSDVIKEINNSAVDDPAKALKLFEDLKSERSISIEVERNGEDLQLQYEIR